MGAEHASSRTAEEILRDGLLTEEKELKLEIFDLEDALSNAARQKEEQKRDFDQAVQALEASKKIIEEERKRLLERIAILHYKKKMLEHVRNYIRQGMQDIIGGSETSGAAYWILEKGLRYETFFNMATEFWRELPSGDAQELGTFGKVLGAPVIRQIIDELKQELGFRETHLSAARQKLRG